jgi:1-acyl-sn-glycerol-3-phosphate acyltransferase
MISSMTSPRSSNSPQKTDLANSGVSAWLAPILYFLGYYFLMPFFFRELTVIGTENIPKTGAVIIAPTHRSRWDALVVPYAIGRIATGRDPRYMVSIDEMQGLQGWFMSRMGGFPVDTKNPGTTLFRYCIDLLKQAQMLVIFPEGNIFRHQKVNPIKPGLARIALQVENTHPKLETKILPVSIRYSQAYPSWRGAFQVCIGSPIAVAEYAKYSSKSATQKLTEDLESQINAVDTANAPSWALKPEEC